MCIRDSYNGDNVGVTVHLIDENIDSGLIIDRQFISMEQGDTIDSLRKKTELLSGKMIADLLIKFDKEGKLLSDCKIREKDSAPESGNNIGCPSS